MTTAQLLDVIRRVAQTCAQRAHLGAAAARRGTRRMPPARHAVGLPAGRLRTALRRGRRSARTVTATAGVAWTATRVTGRAVVHPLRTTKVVLLTLLLVILLTPYTVGGAWEDGKRIWPSSYADCGARPSGGAMRLAHDLGAAVHHVTTAAPVTPERAQEVVLGWWGRAGEFAGTFTAAARGAQPPTDELPPAEQVDQPAACCTPGGLDDPGVLAAGQPGDTPAITAARAAIAAGFRDDPATAEDELVVAVAIAGAESGYDPAAANSSSTARGLWQVMMSFHGPLFAGADWRDPYANARVAKQVYDDAGSWRPWVTYPAASAAYMRQAAQAVTGARGVAGPVAPIDLPTVPPAVPPVQCVPTGYNPTVPAPTGAAEAAVAFALEQRGEPYVWGAEGPSSWDCSGLVLQAFQLPGRPTTATLVRMGQAVPAGQERRGDLIFPSSGHVGIALGDGTMVHAPRTGDVVKVSPYGTPWQVRRLVAGDATPA